MTRWLGWSVGLAMLGCAADVGSREAAVVYGDDDRTDVYAHPDIAMQTLARRSIVALVEADSLSATDGGFTLSGGVRTAAEVPRDGDGATLCDDVAFRDQPAASFCSGTLIASDLVLTVGHCLSSQQDCNGTRFVFDYLYEADGVLATLDADDVYACSEQVVRNSQLDYAIWRLQRPVTGDHGAAPVRTTRASAGEVVAMLGFGDGVPLKIDTGGRVLSSANTYFQANVDAFAGSSGSGVFIDGQVVGMLSQGETDFDYDAARGCYVVNTISDSAPGGGEQIVHADQALYAYCNAYPEDTARCPTPDTWAAGAHRLGCSVARGPGRLPPAVALATLVVGLLGASRRRRAHRSPT